MIQQTVMRYSFEIQKSRYKGFQSMKCEMIRQQGRKRFYGLLYAKFGGVFSCTPYKKFMFLGIAPNG